MSDGGKSKRPSFLLNVVCFRVQGVNISLVLFCTGSCVELNMSSRPAGGSSNLSLPGTPGGDMDSAKRVLSWAVSFEKLLEDPCGVHHFTVSIMIHLGVVFYFPRCVCSHRLFPCRPS